MSENGSQNRLTDKQERAINCLLSEPTAKKAAARARISETTLYRWLNDDPLFAAALKQARNRVLETTLSGLQAASGQAVETLIDVMRSATESPAARVSAARTILEFTLRANDAIETEKRLRALELKLIENGKI
jgi:hypothetical protein